MSIALGGLISPVAVMPTGEAPSGPDFLTPAARWDAREASTITEVSGKVSVWTDLIAGYTLEQSDAAKRPTLRSGVIHGSAGVDFDGTGGLICTDAINSTPGAFSIYLVMNWITEAAKTGDDNQAAFSIEEASGDYISAIEPNNASFPGDDGVAILSTASPSGWKPTSGGGGSRLVEPGVGYQDPHVLCVTCSASGVRVYANGSDFAISDPDYGSINGEELSIDNIFVVGGHRNQELPWTEPIGHVLLYLDQHNAATVASNTADIQDDWGGF